MLLADVADGKGRGHWLVSSNVRVLPAAACQAGRQFAESSV